MLETDFQAKVVEISLQFATILVIARLGNLAYGNFHTITEDTAWRRPLRALC